MLFRHFADAEKECARMIRRKLPLPAYGKRCIKASAAAGLLDARGVISRPGDRNCILRVRDLARGLLRRLAAQKVAVMRVFARSSSPPRGEGVAVYGDGGS